MTNYKLVFFSQFIFDSVKSFVHLFFCSFRVLVKPDIKVVVDKVCDSKHFLFSFINFLAWLKGSHK